MWIEKSAMCGRVHSISILDGSSWKFTSNQATALAYTASTVGTGRCHHLRVSPARLSFDLSLDCFRVKRIRPFTPRLALSFGKSLFAVVHE